MVSNNLATLFWVGFASGFAAALAIFMYVLSKESASNSKIAGASLSSSGNDIDKELNENVIFPDVNQMRWRGRISNFVFFSTNE